MFGDKGSMLKKILIANRGEIALRIIRTCKEMGIGTMAVYSDADRHSLHVRYADEAVNIGPPQSRKSYLDITKIIETARTGGADAIHPGYGFLSENEKFARSCRENDIVFIGPSPETIALAGNKSEARKTLGRLGIPVIPGSADVVSSPDEAVRIAETLGYPVIIKASGGGGGRGMRIVHNEEDLLLGLKVASGEARVAFGNPDLYIEKYLQNPRHIEIQILADHFDHYVHLGERECSIQKRHQKLIEESPSSFVDEGLRAEMCHTALQIARAINYTSAGTVEFLVDQQKRFYFMEVNSRIQVEHPVTEMVTGVDMIRQQIVAASGGKLEMTQDDIRQNGWSIECRINAEDPEDNFVPSPGVVQGLILPGGPGVRVDTHVYDSWEVSPFYDSLIAKVIVWGRNRETAVRRMQRALSEFRIDGMKVTTSFHEKVLRNADFIKGVFDTHFLDHFNKSAGDST
jgi:acetyl-CoA carboxylase biotin carboxylase subunit